ncbi:hypothetical protein niasHS_008849 [Heterodera schachtii]|uniref:Uncharacterized protein n=1 Tax=Heterodera schachtii TaxID=97005 RepID=A0ABD2IVM5_HETSC
MINRTTVSHRRQQQQGEQQQAQDDDDNDKEQQRGRPPLPPCPLPGFCRDWHGRQVEPWTREMNQDREGRPNRVHGGPLLWGHSILMKQMTIQDTVNSSRWTAENCSDQ